MQDMFKKKREGQANGFIFEFVVKTWASISKIFVAQVGIKFGRFFNDGDHT
jgi:hypothetical protein